MRLLPALSARSFVRLCSFFVLFVLGCNPGSSPPAGAPRHGAGGLFLQSESARGAAEGPVRVTYFAPKGEADGPVEISVSFDRPMVALGTSVAADGLLQIEPRVAGTTRWVGSQTLLFEPSSPLPMAAHYRVRVPRGVRALDGQALAEELSFSFATAKLGVVRSEPSDGEERSLPDRALELFFNAPVALERVREHARVAVQVGGGKPRAAEVAIAYPDPNDTKRVRFTPAAPYPPGARVTLRLAAELRGEQGARPLEVPFETSFRVLGPFALAERDPCRSSGGRCAPDGGFSLEFTNPVGVKSVLAALRFDPPLASELALPDDDYESEYVYVSHELAPSSTYEVRIEGALEDAFGNPFKGPRSFTVRTGAYMPSAYFAVDGELLPAGSRSSLPLRVQNVPALELSLERLTPREIEAVATGRAVRGASKAEIQRVQGAAPNERRVLDVELGGLLHDGKGVLLAKARRQGGKSDDVQASSLIAFTDLAPTLKVGAGSGLVWVTRLSTAQPVASARIEIVDCGKVVASGASDAAGVLRFALKKQPECELYALIQHEGDVSYAHQYGGVGPWELTQHYDYGESGPHHGYLFTERGVLRPGETLQVKGVLRTRKERTLVPSAGKVVLSVRDSQDNELEQRELTLSEFGTFAHALRVPGSTPLGPLSIRAQVGEQTFTETVQVAEFRRAEIEAEVRADRESYTLGDTAQMRVHGAYLFGAELADQRVVWSARRVERDVRPEGERYEGFTFSDETRWFEEVVEPEHTTLRGGEGKLDARGELVQAVPLELPLTAGGAGVELEATVDALGASTSARTLVTVTPASFMVGLRPKAQLVATGEPFAVELVAAKLDGEPVRGVALDVRFVRRSYASSLERGDGGALQTTWTHRDEEVGSCSHKSAAGASSCELTAKAPGLHFVRVRAKDAKGRATEAALPLYVYGAGAASWGADEGHVLALKSDRARYRLGDKAKVLVPSPFAEAEALITVEREGVLSVERRHLRGNASTLEVTIDERFVPNAFVSVLLIRPHVPGEQVSEHGPDFRVGAVELQTDVSARRLAVAVTPDAREKRPGDEIEVKLDVRDGHGKGTRAELTVFAVDEGVLALTGYRTPDPFTSLYAPRGLSVWTSDARARLARERSGEDEKGGEEGGGGGGMELRKDFSAVAFYAPSLVTDGEGRARVRFKLPDSLTRFRIMAIAVSTGAELGSGESSVRTKKPLMLRPLLPRVLRVGDALSAGAVVHNDGERDVEVEVRADVSGVKLAGQPVQRVRVPKGRGVEVRYALSAEQAGEARFAFSARGGGESDGFELRREVLWPSPLETVSTSSSTEGKAVEMLGALPGVRRDAGGLEVMLSTSALSELEAPADALVHYAYGCTEQLASRLVGYAAQSALARHGLIADGGQEKRATEVLSSLERHQRADGSFALWESTEPSRYPPLDAFLTGYALVAMKRAEDAGFATSQHGIERAKRFLAQYLRGERDALSQRLSGADVAFVVYALAEQGAYDPAYAGKLFEQRAELPVIAQIELARTLLLGGDGARAETLLDMVLSGVRVTADEAHLERNAGDAYEILMHSDVRATSELLLLVLAAAQEHALSPKLARWLSGAREADGAFQTTQENAWALTALSAYVAASEQVAPAFTASAWLDDRALAEVRLEGRKAKADAQLPMRDVPARGARLAISRTGQGRLYYTLRLKYAKAELPAQPSERGFYVEREYERIAPSELARGATNGQSGALAQVGDYVRVTLRVAVPSARRFVVIEDPVPVGLEPVNFTFSTESQAARALLGLDTGPFDHLEQFDDRVAFAVTALEPGLYRYEYLARAVTPGKFVVPPARSEEMYHPETFGRTGATTFEVEP